MSDFSLLADLTAAYQRQLGALVKRESNRDLMDMHLPLDVLNVIEEELLPALQAITAALDWEPSDADLLGEPPLSSAEMLTAAWQQHLSAHN
jgi:hypothetical protein